MTEHTPTYPRPRGSPERAELAIHRREPAAGVSVVSVAGEVDLATEDAFRQALVAAAADPGTALLVCDLTKVTYLACGGMSVLVEVRNLLDRRRAALRVVATRSLPRRLLTVTGLAEHLGLCADLTEAFSARDTYP
ncbi:STAS domain-containing protein [Phytohabitans suffuscus]|uniref:Anti-sigma factor antagonist n=1 Tax=Phytohabitans suffuscus TaxID=624315 RepID=A0A6F8Y9N0_9ACTN|nr:STAS domain-containing protein [Phytohabitans suffuscus]BCB82688.1 hypothetical protein Psuf_000010 [Phytohabitans suffuscus]